MIILAVILIFCVIAAFAYKYLIHSDKIDKFTKEIIDEDYESKQSTKSTIDKVEGIKDNLGKQSKDNIKQSKKLEKDSSTIDDYLDNKKKSKKEDTK